MYRWFIFAGRPEKIFALAGIFLLEYLILFFLGRRIISVKSWPLLAVAIAWVLVGLWEIYCFEQGHNIRVDVLFIYPILIVISLLGFFASVVSMIFGLFKSSKQSIKT